MKQFLAMLALAGFIAGCHTAQEENMGSTGSDSTTVIGSETNGSTINTNGTNSSVTQPSNGNSQSGSEPNGSH